MIASAARFITGSSEGISGKTQQYQNIGYRTKLPSDPVKRPVLDGLTISEFPSFQGSVGCVYTAVDTNGTKIAIKMLRPGVEKKLKDDIALITGTSKVLSFFNTSIAQTIENTGRHLLNEIHLLREMKMCLAVSSSKTLAMYPSVTVPFVHRALCSNTTFVYDFAPGVSINELPANIKVTQKACEDILGCVFDLLHRDKIVIGDANAGNFVWDARCQKITLIDFGAVSFLPPTLYDLIRDMHVAQDEGGDVRGMLVRYGILELESVMMTQVGQFWSPFPVVFKSVQLKDVTMQNLSARFDPGIEQVFRQNAQLAGLFEYLGVAIAGRSTMQGITRFYKEEKVQPA